MKINHIHTTLPILKQINLKNMSTEHVTMEKEAVSLVHNRICELASSIEQYIGEGGNTLKDWIENTELANILQLSLRTLQNYRQSGVLGFSIIGRKIYYKRKDVEELILNRTTIQKKE